ncbi:hypothetical protein HPB52_021666 [Rhipicephalus sanguineus]|uniref:Secreted protein n=1 Tax=Rhipicephalus sanguineus TaxID=34632 RepID=A0A9D4Q320_RHISA|nr:hypothetical protein HPB52_021666 [Rhipicephalus sanguineus]
MWHSGFLFIVTQLLGFVGFAGCADGAAFTVSTDGGFDKGPSCDTPDWCVGGARPLSLLTVSSATSHFPQFAFPRSVTATATSTSHLPDPLKSQPTDLITSGHGRTTKMWHSRFIFIVTQLLGFVGFAGCADGAAFTVLTGGGFDKGPSCDAPDWCVGGARPLSLLTVSSARTISHSLPFLGVSQSRGHRLLTCRIL